MTACKLTTMVPDDTTTSTSTVQHVSEVVQDEDILRKVGVVYRNEEGKEKLVAGSVRFQVEREQAKYNTCMFGRKICKCKYFGCFGLYASARQDSCPLV